MKNTDKLSIGIYKSATTKQGFQGSQLDRAGGTIGGLLGSIAENAKSHFGGSQLGQGLAGLLSGAGTPSSNVAQSPAGSGGPGMFPMNKPEATAAPAASPKPKSVLGDVAAQFPAGSGGPGMFPMNKPEATAAPAASPAPSAQPDFLAQFKKYHGTSFDPNSRRDKQLLAQMQAQSPKPGISPKSVYSAQYGAWPNKKTANTEKFTTAIYLARMEKQAMTGRLLGGAKNLAKGFGHGASTALKELIQLPKTGYKGYGDNGLRDMLSKKVSPGGRATAIGEGVGSGLVTGSAISAPVVAGHSIYDSGKSKGLTQGMAKGREQGLAEMLSQVQGQKQERGYLGNLLDAIMNKQQGV